MTLLDFLATRPELVTTLTKWGWCLVVAVSVRMIGGVR
jgi:hypothetical protein